MTRRLIFAPQAQADLENLLDYIAARAGRNVALKYVARIEAFCRRLREFPARGSLRNELAEDLRVVGFEKRISIAFHIEPDSVIVDRVLYGGQDIDQVLRPGDL